MNGQYVGQMRIHEDNVGSIVINRGGGRNVQEFPAGKY